MPAKRLSMRKIKEVLRLKGVQGLSNRQIAKACGIGRPAVIMSISRNRRHEYSGPTARKNPEQENRRCQVAVF